MSQAQGVSAYDFFYRKATDQNLADDPIWRSLIHYTDGACLVPDPNFTLSSPTCSPEAELLATINAFFYSKQRGNDHPLCRFPARLFFLKKKLETSEFAFPYVDCPEFDEYRKKAKADRISLVFASENVTQPVSMMGHVFFRLTATSPNESAADHAVTFFTVLDTANLPKLLIQSLFFGMPGYFSLAPYHESRDKYLNEEERNIWEYPLSLSESQTTLLSSHMWELRGVKQSYLLGGYNCATVVYFILSLANPLSFPFEDAWLTPLDVIKAAKKAGIITSVSVVPSPRWRIMMLSQVVSSQDKINVKEAVTRNSPALLSLNKPEASAFLMSDLASTYADFLSDRGEKIDADSFYRLKEQYSANYSIDLSSFKDPLKTPPDSSVTLSSVFMEGRNMLGISYLPASHLLGDDNRQYFGESSLELGRAALLYDYDKDLLKLDRLNLYSAKQLTPWDYFTGGFSRQFTFGIEPSYDKNLHRFMAVDGNIGFGAAAQVSRDILSYALINVGGGWAKGGAYPYVFPEVGVVVNEIFDMKTIASFKETCGQRDFDNCYQETEISQSLYLNNSITVIGSAVMRSRANSSENRFEAGFRYHF